MKKLLVLSLVLAVASLANAGLALTGAGNVLNVTSDSGDPYVANIVFVLPVDSADVALTAIGNKDLSFLTDYGVMAGADLGLAVGDVHLFNFSAASSTVGALQPGLHLTGTANQELFADGQVAGVYLMSEDFSTILGTLYVVPEPMTMVLLGLGGLFLRKRS